MCETTVLKQRHRTQLVRFILPRQVPSRLTSEIKDKLADRFTDDRRE